MQSFIFDYYGYNANVENNEFEYEGYKFLLLSVEDDEKDIIKLNDLVNSLNIHFNSDVVFIVKNFLELIDFLIALLHPFSYFINYCHRRPPLYLRN